MKIVFLKDTLVNNALSSPNAYPRYCIENALNIILTCDSMSRTLLYYLRLCCGKYFFFCIEG